MKEWIEADLNLNKDGPLAARGLISFTEAQPGIKSVN